MDLEMELEEFIENPDAVTTTTLITRDGIPQFVVMAYPFFVEREERLADLRHELSQVR